MTRQRSAAASLVFLAAAAAAFRGEAAPYVDEAVQDQWFTGSLEAPSPALPKAGILAIEPYAFYTANTGAYDSSGNHYSVAHDLNQIQALSVIKYAITDRLSVQALPSLSYAWTDQATSSGVGLGDLPVELEYRLNEMNRKTGVPSVTVELGMSFPTGAYNQLRRPLDGFGSGAYIAKEGILFQSLFDTWASHPMRLRFFGAAYEPLGDVSLHNVSAYGTAQGFQGHAAPGFSTQVGVGGEYGLDQRWVLALDLVESYAGAFHLNGTNGAGASVQANGATSTSFQVAPAVEFNWSDSMGVIAGVAFTTAGHNTPSSITPQIALSMAF
jgi:hypothetical protein